MLNAIGFALLIIVSLLPSCYFLACCCKCFRVPQCSKFTTKWAAILALAYVAIGFFWLHIVWFGELVVELGTSILELLL